MIKEKIAKPLFNISCISILAIILVPVLVYSFLSIPYADDFSYTSNIREAAETYGGILKGLFARIWFEYTTSEGGMYKVFCMTAGQLSFLKFGLTGLRLYIFFCHIAFYAVLLWLVSAIIKRCVKKNTFSTVLCIFTILVFWIINNQLNTEMYTWALIQSAYVIPITTMMLGIVLHIKYLNLSGDSNRKNVFFVLSVICGFITSGSPLNIVILNCGLIFIICYYGIKQLGLKPAEWSYWGISLIGALINLIAPGNGARHGSEWGLGLFFRTLFIACKHSTYKVGSFISHTPFLCLCILIAIILYKYAEFNYEGKITYNHPILFAVFCLTGLVLVDWPYTFGNNIVELRAFEGRVDFVSDIALYFVTLLWIFYFIGFFKKNVSIKAKELSRVSALIIASLMVLSILIILSNGMSNYTTPYMISSLRNGSAKEYSDYQEKLLEKVQNSEGEVHLVYDCDVVPKKHPVIIGLKLCDNPDDPGLFWQNNAVARYYFKTAVYIEYLN